MEEEFAPPQKRQKLHNNSNEIQGSLVQDNIDWTFSSDFPLGNSFELLDDFIILHIFEFLHSRTSMFLLNVMARICKRFREIALSPRLWTYLGTEMLGYKCNEEVFLVDDVRLFMQILSRLLLHFDEVVHLNLLQQKIDGNLMTSNHTFGSNLQVQNQLIKLKKLKLMAKQTTGSTLSSLISSAPNLESLHLIFIHSEDKDFEVISQLGSSLKDLAILFRPEASTAISSIVVDSLFKKCTSLEKLTITKQNFLTGSNVATILENCTKLQYLKLKYMTSPKSIFFKFKRVSLLYLTELRLEGLGLRYLSFICIMRRAPNLRFLRFAEWGWTNVETRLVMESLPPALETLIIRDTMVDDPTFHELVARCTRLKKLSIDIHLTTGNVLPLSDYGVSVITQLKELENIRIEDCKITSVGFESLTKNPLSHVRLGSCSLLNNISWSGPSRIGSLCLSRIENLTDQDLDYLSQNLPTLARFFIEKCPKTTGVGLSSILKNTCHILVFFTVRFCDITGLTCFANEYLTSIELFGVTGLTDQILLDMLTIYEQAFVAITMHDYDGVASDSTIAKLNQRLKDCSCNDIVTPITLRSGWNFLIQSMTDEEWCNVDLVTRRRVQTALHNYTFKVVVEGLQPEDVRTELDISEQLKELYCRIAKSIEKHVRAYRRITKEFQLDIQKWVTSNFDQLWTR